MQYIRKPQPAPNGIRVGKNVQIYFGDVDEWRDAVITRENDDGTYHIICDGDEIEDLEARGISLGSTFGI